MASILVRGLDDAVKSGIAHRAKENGRSMEAEVREILTQAVRRPNIGVAILDAFSGGPEGDEFVVPARNDQARVAIFE
ncbi:plasmid stability protein [Arcanobacterium wilhelmae]|uniref:Plasmid stability protein n=1 Tax=Arcanobacterium wilhelmae TaxID=1803177 RepID=A0ABT9NC36_9ACTO|nr:Arc family DNA-binding protein [Arcanobacterium wilhelmae]MDP9801265.1 plasmid stability protein [Arcanobacterium wilhelmae]WFN90610.1 Arc family DNA-binding protein [Arcanobacterium wilhelmae]